MNYFNLADWLVISVYLIGIIWLGTRFGKGQQNTRDYFLGNKNIPWWSIGLSIVAAETSALTIISVPAMAYGDNLSFLQVIIGYVLARVLLAIVLVPHYFKGEIYSPYHLLERSFGPSARRLAAGLFVLSETHAAGVRGYVASIPGKLLLGEKLLGLGTGDPILGAILLFVVLALVYTYFGGVKAVIWTDAVQFALFMAGGLFTLFYVPTLISGGAPALFTQAAAAGKLHWFNGGFSLSLPFNIWMGILGGTFVVLSSHGAEQLIVQRVLACRSVADGRKALVLSAVCIFPLFAIFLLVGVMLWVLYHQIPMALPIPEIRAGSGIKANDYVYPIFMLTVAPHVLRGFLIVTVLSAAMSSVSSALTSLASVSTMDFFKPLSRKPRTEVFFLAFSRISTIGWACLLIVVAYLSREVAYVLNAAFSLRGLTSGALLGGLILVLLWRKGTALPVVIGSLVSFVAMVCISQVEWQAVDPQGRLVAAKMAWPWFTLTGTAITIATAWMVRACLPKRAVSAH